MLTSRPGVPNSDGMRTLNPASTTRCANATTCGCRPGISWITITAGPRPPAYTGRVRPSYVNVDARKPGSSTVTVWNTTGSPSRERGATVADDLEGIEEVEVVTAAVGDDGTVVVDDLTALVDEDGNVLATDET